MSTVTVTASGVGQIQPIETNGVISAYQLRVDGGGPGKTKFFAVRRLGGAYKALHAAKKEAKVLGLSKTEDARRQLRRPPVQVQHQRRRVHQVRVGRRR